MENIQYKEAYTPQEWNLVLKESCDPKKEKKQNVSSLNKKEIRKKIKERLLSLKASDISYKLKTKSKERLVSLYLWLLDFCDDPHHCSPIFESIRRSKDKKFIPDI